MCQASSRTGGRGVASQHPLEPWPELQALALCLAGKRDAAGALGAKVGPGIQPKDRLGWEWLEATCGVPSPMAASPSP